MRAAGLAKLAELGLAGVNLAGRSFNSGRKALEKAGFILDRTTQTGRKVFRNPQTVAECSTTRQGARRRPETSLAHSRQGWANL